MRTNLLRGLIHVVAVLALCAPAGAKDDVLILRLEDEAPAKSTPADKPAETTSPGGPVIQVPQCADRCAPKPVVSAISAVLMDADTGQIIYAKNPHLRRPNASTTKIMTAILLIENCGMSTLITASKNACQTPYTSLNLKPGEQITAKDLLTGMLVRSANDAAVAVAEKVGGSVQRFSSLMNQKAKEIGCTDTHFVTPNGLPAKDHYSSAYDLCLMARYALRYPVFDEAVNTRKYFLSSRTINRKDMAVFAKSKFLKNYPGADGVKSGYVKEAGHCYVGSATRDGWRLVSAVLKSGNTAQDTAAMMDYAFGNYKPVVVARADQACVEANVKGGSRAGVPAAPSKDFRVAVPKTGGTVTTTCQFRELEAPVPAGTVVGAMIASVDGVEAARVELQSTERVDISLARRVWAWTRWCGLVLVCLAMGRRYGNAFTKGSRRRRRRVPEALRSFNRYG